MNSKCDVTLAGVIDSPIAEPMRQLLVVRDVTVRSARINPPRDRTETTR